MAAGNCPRGIACALTMDRNMDERVLDEAIAWQACLEEEDADWEGYTAWLDADPRHRAAFDEIALLDDSVRRNRHRLTAMLPMARVEPVGPAPSRRWAYGTAIGAAALALVVGLNILPIGSPEPVTYRTDRSGGRTIALADGSRIELAAASRLTVSGRAQNELNIEGAAYFDVPHDPGRQLAVHAGNYTVSDIGTRFEISSSGSNVRIAVAQGTVSVESASLADPVNLVAGQRFTASAAHRAEVGAFGVADIAAWRGGRLIYEDTPLLVVAAEISRYAGKTVTVDPSLAGRRFSGVLTIGDGSGLVGNLQQFMDLDSQAAGDTVRLVARRRR